MPAAKTKKPKPAKVVGPDDLTREAAGNYVSGDGRFEVRQSDASWYLVDREQANEFGQELIHGPFPTLKSVKQAIPGSRELKPLLRSQRRPVKPATKPEAKKPQSWIDKLDPKDATEVRTLVRALEREGIDDAEALVRKDRGGLSPAVAQRLLDRRIEEVIDSFPADERALANRVIGRLGKAISASEGQHQSLPGWALFETGARREPTSRRLRFGG